MYNQKEEQIHLSTHDTIPPVLEALQITKHLPLGREHIDILKGITFRVERGEMLAIVGPSGSGKSTLLGILAGLDNPTSGQMVLDGIDIVTAPTFIAPTTGSVKILLTGNQVIVTQTFLTHYHKKIGDTFDIQVQSLVQSSAIRTLHVRLAGVIANTGAYPTGNTFVLVSFATYQAADPSQAVTYAGIDIATKD
ncbi:hypothetical protein ccbrp13_32410 [Ktedonobacteria bacterium brp13]|nr:hypothetical protein ccbrp13_32410 [Ktedonobacteria bacterium brp13]